MDGPRLAATRLRPGDPDGQQHQTAPARGYRLMQVELVQADLVVVGSLSPDLASVAADFERRLSRYVKLQVHELRAEPTQRGSSVVLRAEAERFGPLLDRLARRGDPPTLVALDSRGQQPTSEELAAAWLRCRHLVVLIGGTLGLPQPVLDRADSRVAFGRITLPHQMARVVATEQLYRCFRIARGDPYHF